MYAGADEDKDQRGDDRIGNADLRLQPLSILRIALVDTLEEFLAVLYIFRMCVYLIHQPIFFAVFFWLSNTGPLSQTGQHPWGRLAPSP